MKNKTILITGGTGSLGQELAKQLFKLEVGKVIIYSRGEYAQYQMKTKWPNPGFPVRYFIGDVRDRERLSMAFAGVDIVIHCAALKHVDIGEYNPFEAVKTNVLGAQNVIEAAIKHNVERVVAISSDKAVNPVNLYGATKLCADKLFTAANVYSGRDQSTIFSVVRYGNVLGSRGSVVPFFKERAVSGVLPITDPRMTRFWITLDQAVHFVLQTTKRAKGGEIFVPRIPSMRITDLAEAIAPECKHETVGIRPGEKLHESMIGEDDARNTVAFNDCYVIQAHLRKREQLLEAGGKACPDGFDYNSADNEDWLKVEELRDLVKQIADDYSIEHSRWAMEDMPD